MAVQNGKIPYNEGTIIIIPPNTLHGSTSENGFVNISVLNNFKHLPASQEIITLQDNSKKEGLLLVTLLYNNRFGTNELVASLCESYFLFLMSKLNFTNKTDMAVNEIVTQITTEAFDVNFNIKNALYKSKYAPDYIRNQFKKQVGKTPTQFLNEIRINRAQYLINIYNGSCSMSQIAEECGFVDYVYFSKCFKKFTGCAPSDFKRLHTSHR